MRGTLTAQRYVDDILRPHVGPFLNGIPGALFQQDNARPHTTRVAQDLLTSFSDSSMAGWKGVNCEFPCSSDYYGQDCAKKCECKNGAACNPVDGSCTCTPGYKGKIDESRFNLSSDDNRVRVWRPRGERLYPVFALQRHTAPTAGLMYQTSREDDRFGVVDKVLAYGTEGIQIESSPSLVTLCNEVCAKGTWGLYCKETCTCKNEATCLPDTGQCLCTPGWKGGNCELPCSSDYYGQECKQKCECENGAACNPVDGSCTCTPGYKGKNDESSSDDNRVRVWRPRGERLYPVFALQRHTAPTAGLMYQTSREDDRFGVVDKVLAYGTEGWKGGNCELPCSSDYYGQECKQKCECENGAACNPVDGSCTCTPGYKGKK
ncbi:multiple epidermal growth factor-like domains protein 11 [Trichonephila clavipes]|nr:multiple epidermal growth factor-like domains protein 11 [Trichonephila clavipes]